MSVSVRSVMTFAFVTLFTLLLLAIAPLTHAQWVEASSTALINSAIASLSSALYNVLVIIIPVAVAVGIFFFAYAWVRGVFRNRR